MESFESELKALLIKYKIPYELNEDIEDIMSYILSYIEDIKLDIDDSMDGDAQSALASAGFGTDEDYSYGGTE